MRILFFFFLSTALSLADPIAPPEFDTPQLRLLYFACDGDVEGIDAALEEGAQIDERSGAGFNALHYTILLNREKAFAHLLGLGADLTLFCSVDQAHGKSKSIDTLGLCVVYDRFEMAESLLRGGVDCMNTQASYGAQMSALAYAALHNRVELIKHMVTTGADVHRRIEGAYWSRQHPTEVPLLAIAAQHGGLEVIRYLVEDHGIEVNHNALTPHSSPLWVAVKYGNIEVVKYLIQHGADVNAVNVDWNNELAAKKLSCLSVAAKYGWAEITELLLAAGAQIRTDAAYEELPYVVADMAGYSQIYAIYEALGYESKLWDFFEQGAAKKRDAMEVPDKIENDLGWAAKILEGEWQGRLAETSSESAGSTVSVALVADAGSQDLSDLLTVELSGYDHIRLMERNELDRILREHALDRAELATGAGMSRCANLLGAEALIFVKEVKIENEIVHEIQLINAVQGLQLNTTYCPSKGKAMVGVVESYATNAAAAMKLFYRDLKGVVPVALVNVRSDQGTAAGLRFENYFERLLEMKLVSSKGLLLMQRDGVETLLREKQLAGLESEAFSASAVFLDVRLDLNEEQSGLASATFRIEDAEGAELRVTVDATSSDIDSIVEQVYAAFLEEMTIANVEVQGAKTLERDASKLYRESRWLESVGLPQQSLSALKSAIALGYDELNGWALYLKSVEKMSSKIRAPEGEHILNLRRLELERERLVALDGYWKLWQADVARRRLKVHRSERGLESGAFSEFGNTLAHFQSVSLKRRYAVELNELEVLYLGFTSRRMLALYDDPEIRVMERFKGDYPTDVLMKLFEPLPRFRTSVDRLGAVVKQFAHGHAQIPEYHYGLQRYSPRAYCAPELGPIWDDYFLGWLNESAAPNLSAAYALGLLVGHVSSSSFTSHRRLGIQAKEALCRQIDRNQQQANELNRASLLSLLQGVELPSSLFQGGSPQPQMDMLRLSSKGPTYRTVKLQRSNLLYLQLRNNEQALRAEDFNHYEPLKGAYDAFISTADDSEVSDKKVLHQFEQRLQAMNPDGDSDAETSNMYGEVPAKIWHPSLYGFPRFGVENNFIHDPVLADGFWWVIGVIRYDEEGERLNVARGDHEYVLFKINPETLETTGRSFKSAVLGSRSYFTASASEGHLALWRIQARKNVERNGSNPLTILNLDTLEVRSDDKYMPVMDGYSVDGKFYSLVTPWEIYDKKWNASNPPESLLFIEYDLASGESNVLFNSRRNPLETIMDRPPGRDYFFSFNATKRTFLIGEGYRAVYELDSRKFRKLGKKEKSRLLLRKVNSSGFSKSHQVGDGYWFNDSIRRGERFGLRPEMVAFIYYRYVAGIDKPTGRVDKRAVIFDIEEPSVGFEPYERYKVALNEETLGFSGLPSIWHFSDDRGYASINCPIDSIGRPRPFYVFFDVDDFDRALLSGKSVWGRNDEVH